MFIDIYRHLLAVAVIIQHMTSQSRYDAITNTQISDIVYWVDGAVMGFFAISGYLSRPQLNLSRYIRSQAVRLFTPYLIFSIIYVLALSILGKDSFTNGAIKTATLYGGSMQLYFLPYLFFVTCSFAIYNKYIFKNSNSEVSIAIWIASFSIPVLIFSSDRSTGAGLIMLPLYAISFGLGSITATTKIGVQIAIATTLMTLGFIDHRATDLGLVFSGLVVFSAFSKKFPKRRLPGSGGIYLFHTPIMNFGISTILVGIGIVQTQNLFTSIALTYMMCLGITWVLITLLPQWKWIFLE